MANKRSLPLCVLASTLLVSLVSIAQPTAPAARITGPIDEDQLVTLKGNTVPAANAKNDRGPVSPGLPMANLVLVLSRSSEQQAAFDAYVRDEYDASSPYYHQWLSPEQIGGQFGPAQADIVTLTSWLSGHGFAGSSIAPDRMTITFSGTAGQVESTFHTQIHTLSVNGKMHIANMTDPQIPAALAPVVAGVKGLHNFFPHPLHRLGTKVHFNPDAHGWVKLGNSASASLASGGVPMSAPTAAKPLLSPKPGFYINDYNLGVEEDVAPYDFAAIYNLTPVWNNSINGSGQTITIIGTSDIDLTDVSNFKSAFGLPAGSTPVTAHGPDGDPGNCGGNPSGDVCNDGDLDENSLDVEWSGAVAPSAQIVLVTDAYNSQTQPTNDPIFDGAQWAIDNAYVQGTAVYGSRIVSLSYGQCELFNGTASNVAYYNLWQTAASAGIAVFAATGDSGSPSCDEGGDFIGNPYEAQYGLSVSGLASTPYNTAVGGTDFSWCKPTINSSGDVANCGSSQASTYWNTSNNSTTEASAKGYVPETPWNDTCENPINAAFLASIASYVGAGSVPAPEQSCNFIYADSMTLYEEGDPPLMYYVDTVGGSGGASGCVVNDADTSNNPTCTAGATTTGSSDGNLTLVNNGWPKPSWQAAAASLGVPNDGVRDLPDVSLFAGDGTLDSASLICVSNDGAQCTNISETGSSNLADTGGAEEVGGTSVGTPQMAGVMALINQKAGASQGSPNPGLYTLAGKQTYSSCSAETGTTSNGCYFNDIDQGTNAMPCVAQSGTAEGGAVYDPETGEWEPTTAVEGTISPNCSIVNAGDVVGTLSGYSAITGYDQASGLGSLNIANVVNADVWTATTGTAAATVGINLGGVTSISESQSLSVAVTVAGSSGTPTGNVTLSANLNGYISTEALSGGTVTFTIPANTFTSAGTVTLTAAYSGSSSYAPGSAGATVTVTSSSTPPPTTGTFALATIASPASVSPGNTATTTASVSASSGYAGTVTLNCTLTNEPSGAANLPSCASSGTITLSAAATSGSATLSVTTTPPTVESSGLTPTHGKDLFGAAGGAALALLVFFGIPARRRSWRAMLGMVLLLVTLGSLAACGGGGTTTTTVPGTTAGTYTFTVTAVGNPTISTTQTQTFTVTVN
jgi:Pro-kumamolisin, activation domain/Bacterial Ig-like domain (group 3)